MDTNFIVIILEVIALFCLIIFSAYLIAPRKTTTDSKKELVGKIEKFDYPVSSPFYIEHHIIMDKINELVDAVNELKGSNNE